MTAPVLTFSSIRAHLFKPIKRVELMVLLLHWASLSTVNFGASALQLGSLKHGVCHQRSSSLVRYASDEPPAVTYAANTKTVHSVLSRCTAP